MLIDAEEEEEEEVEDEDEEQEDEQELTCAGMLDADIHNYRCQENLVWKKPELLLFPRRS